MPYCCVITCKNHSKKTNNGNSGITYHRFPENDGLRQKWIKAISLSDDWVPQKNSSICSKHFADKDIFLTGDGRVIGRLAVPCLHLNESDDESDDDDAPLESQRIANQKAALVQAEKLIKEQRLTIKLLKEWKKRNTNKMALQTRVIEDLMEIYELKKGDIAVLKEYILKSNAKPVEESD